MQLLSISSLLLLAASLASAAPTTTGTVDFSTLIRSTDDGPLNAFADEVKAAGGVITVPIGPRNISEFGFLQADDGSTLARSIVEDLGYASHNYSATYHDMTFEGFNATAPRSFTDSKFLNVFDKQSSFYRAPTGFALEYLNSTMGVWIPG